MTGRTRKCTTRAMGLSWIGKGYRFPTDEDAFDCRFRNISTVPGFKNNFAASLYHDTALITFASMIKVGEVLVSDDVRDKEFVCNLEKCKGACCIEGDFGAPLDEEELAILEEIYPKIKKYLSAKGIKEIEKNGTHAVDDEGELCTPVIDGRECVYAIYDKKGILKCGIEQAYNDGKITWKKPISCHLYPIRITQKKNFEALNYHKWHICSPACTLGKSLQVPVYKFLKDPLIRKYGKAWYAELVHTIESPKE